MRWNKIIVFPMFLLLVFQIGCGRDKTAYLEMTEWDTETFAENSAEISAKAAADTTKAAADHTKSDSTNESSDRLKSDPTLKPAVDPAEKTKELPAEGTAKKETGQPCYVYVCGAVVKPGVYVLSDAARIYEAVEMAGGLLEEASAESVNQAEPVTDGMMIRIPTKEEALQEPLADTVSQSGSDNGDEGKKSTGGSNTDDGRINLNTAEASDLMTLPGIGQSKADSIIAYREQNGGFSSVESIMDVDGIKEGVYNRIKDRIKVN